MRNYIYNTAKAVAPTLLLLLFLLPSCSKESGNEPEIPETKYAKLTITLGSADNAQPSGTRAGGSEGSTPDTEEPETYERRIDECWVVIFDADGKWVATVSTKDFNINNKHDDSESTTTVDLLLGNYTGYAFANLNSLTDGSELINILESGKVDASTALTPQYLNTRAVTLNSHDNFKLTGGKGIPMSSYPHEFEVKETGENKAEIGMFRMLGKVEISITNKTGKALTLNSLSMGKFREGAILLVPYTKGDLTLDQVIKDGDIANQLSPEFPTDATSSYTHTVAVTDENKNLPVDKTPVPYSFYAFETGPETNQTDNGDLSINIKIGDREASVKSTDFSMMRRNDWLKIPVNITDITTVLRFENTRMPIGGLPYQLVYGEDGIQILVDAVNPIPSNYAGPVKVEYELQSISDGAESLQDLKIVYDTDQTTGKGWSSAELSDNTDELIIDKATGNPIEATDETLSKITLQASPKDPANPTGGTEATKGYFEVWTQELGKNSSATIKLTLVAEYGTETPKQKIEIPYTIRIQNYKEGGN